MQKNIIGNSTLIMLDVDDSKRMKTIDSSIDSIYLNKNEHEEIKKNNLNEAINICDAYIYLPI